MSISEKAEQMKKSDYFDKLSICFWLDPPMKNIKKSKNVKHLILMNVQDGFLDAPCFTEVM